MLKLNLQTFGGRGSSGGKRSGGGGNTSSIPAAERQFPSGTYIDSDGDEHSVEYTRNSAGTITQVIDGQPYGGSIEMTSAKGARKYIGTNPNGGAAYTNSLAEAASYAFGKPSDLDWKKKR